MYMIMKKVAFKYIKDRFAEGILFEPEIKTGKIVIYPLGLDANINDELPYVLAFKEKVKHFLDEGISLLMVGDSSVKGKKDWVTDHTEWSDERKESIANFSLEKVMLIIDASIKFMNKCTKGEKTYFLLGHSLGCSPVLAYSNLKKNKAKKVFMISWYDTFKIATKVHEFSFWTNMLYDATESNLIATNWFIEILDFSTKYDLRNFNDKVPYEIFQPEKDQHFTYKQLEEMDIINENVKIHKIPNAEHQLLNKLPDKKIDIRDLSNWEEVIIKIVKSIKE